MAEDHSERIAILETKLDTLQQLLSDIDEKLDAIGHRQLEIDVTAKVAYNAGKTFLFVATTVLGWLNWDQLVAWVHQMTSHQAK
jgi:hypothetical protein